MGVFKRVARGQNDTRIQGNCKNWPVINKKNILYENKSRNSKKISK